VGQMLTKQVVSQSEVCCNSSRVDIRSC
jgi:hypothetical protein